MMLRNTASMKISRFQHNAKCSQIAYLCMSELMSPNRRRKSLLPKPSKTRQLNKINKSWSNGMKKKGLRGPSKIIFNQCPIPKFRKLIYRNLLRLINLTSLQSLSMNCDKIRGTVQMIPSTKFIASWKERAPLNQPYMNRLPPTRIWYLVRLLMMEGLMRSTSYNSCEIILQSVTTCC